MSEKIKSIVFALITAIICGLLLSGASIGLKKFKIRNIAIDRQKNILKSVGLVDASRRYSPEDIERLYDENIKCFFVDSTGQMMTTVEKGPEDLPICLYLKDNELESYVLPINTRGLWGKIHGYLALKKDGSTIFGFAIYKHSETPGLGGEIERNWFQNNFIGKKIIDSEGDFVSISVAKGSVSQKILKEQRINYVDGISGATLTGKYLTSGLKEILLDYEPISINFRKNNIKLPDIK